MKKNYILLYSLLLVLPALFIGIMALRWLRHEEERLRLMAEAALQEQAAVMAGHLDVLLHDATERLLEDLRRLPADDPDALRRWRDAHPLIRHIFLWDPEEGLSLPDPRWANAEEEAFIRRYEALFSGRQSWPVKPGKDEAPSAPSSTYVVQRARREVAQRRMDLAESREAPDQTQGGWLPWFWERDAHLLGWQLCPDREQRRGVELEILALCARFQPFFAENGTEAVFALYDHHGKLIMQQGAYEQRRTEGMSVTVPVSPLLPHWQVGAATAAPSAGGSFALFSGLLLAILLVAILGGGGLLAWQGYRDYYDARRKTTFVSNVSHELKTPLTTIRLYAEMLRDRRIREESKREAYLGVLVEESERLTRLVNNVLDFSRLEQGRKTYRRERVDLVEWLGQAAARQTDRLRGAGLALRLAAPPVQSAEVHSDRDALEQTLLNLLDNAAKYASDGGEVTVSLADGGTHWAIEVADHGPGVPPGQEERIFGSFYRVDDSLTARVPGTGLGLSIGRRLLRELGGDLLYRPRPGGGAIFVLWLRKEAPNA